MYGEKTVSLMFLLVALIFTIVGGTFAYLTWQLTEENRNSLVFTVTGDFKCSVDGGGDVNTEGVTFMPVNSFDCNNSEHILKRELTFNVVKNYTNDVKLYSWFNINNLGSYLRGNSNFKLVLSSQESCTEGIVKSGDFSELTEDSEKIILFNDVYNETTISKYYLYMWLDKEETRIPDEDLSSRIFDLSLDGELEIPANTTINHDVYLSESAYNQKTIGENNYLTIAVVDNGLQINYNKIIGFIPGINHLGQASLSSTDFFGQEFTRDANETRILQGTIDVSEKNNGSIMTNYYESDTSGQYDFYIGSSDGVVYGNPDSSYAFGGIKSYYSYYAPDGNEQLVSYGIYSNLVSINGMEYLDTLNVVNMSYMFNGCSGLTTLNLSNFNTSKVKELDYIFFNCRKLTTLNIKDFTFDNVTVPSYMLWLVPSSCKITVGSSAAKSWLNTNYSSYTNVVIG